MEIQSLHHVAYRCKDAKETADFYSDLLGLPYVAAMSESHVPSTGEECPYMHIFFQMADGSCVAFFELPEAEPMERATHEPEWVQHLALRVEDEAALLGIKDKLEAKGIDVLGPTDHTVFKSIYFFDPSGHRLELTYNTATPEMTQRLRDTAKPMLEEWTTTKKVSKSAAWVHEGLNH